MDQPLHKVTPSELPALRDWLHQYMPDSRKLYFTVLSIISGKWQGPTFYTLGWPNILAVAEGPVSPEESNCALYFTHPRTTHVYAPEPSHAEALLLSPGFIDWTQPVFFQAQTKKLRETIKKVSASKGGNLIVFANVMVEATAEEMPPSPVPEGFELRPLDPDKHSDYVLGTWPMRRRHTFSYIRELLKRLPTLGLFDKSTGQCAGYELIYEYGALGMLFVMEEFRGRGFGKVITTNLAQHFFQEGHSVAAWVIKSNKPSMRMHFDSGFREEAGFDFLIHHIGPQTDYFKKYGYLLKSWEQP